MSEPNSTRSGASSGHMRGIAIVVLGVFLLSPDGLLTTLVSADIMTMLFWRGLLMAITLTVFTLGERGQGDC